MEGFKMATKKSAAKLIGMDWNLAQIWEESFRCIPDRPMQQRSRIYASELGGSFHDRYLKMYAHKFSNPYNFRSLGKMMAGKFFEAVVKTILIGTGIYRHEQLKGLIELPNCLPVSGKLDFVAGGQIDWDEAKNRAEKVKQFFGFIFEDLSPFTNHMTDKVLEHFKNVFSYSPLMEKILEVKSVSGFVFGLIKKGNKPRRGHPLQGLHYLLANKHIEKGLLTYISREDVVIQEFDITREKGLLKEYKEDVSTMTAYYNDSIGKNYLKHIPPKDEEILFEEASYRFVKSNKVEYSPYLTMSYGYKNIDHFKEKWDKQISKWNAAFRRHVLEGTEIPTVRKGQPATYTMKLTPANLDTIKEAKVLFPLWDKFVAKAKASGVFDKPEQDGEDE